ncbi:hypothetical protein ACVB44_005247, partial [Escherichia coli]
GSLSSQIKYSPGNPGRFKDFFTNPVGGSLTVIFELFCFVISVPVVAIYLIFIFCKTLSGK